MTFSPPFPPLRQRFSPFKTNDLETQPPAFVDFFSSRRACQSSMRPYPCICGAFLAGTVVTILPDLHRGLFTPTDTAALDWFRSFEPQTLLPSPVHARGLEILG